MVRSLAIGVFLVAGLVWVFLVVTAITDPMQDRAQLRTVAFVVMLLAAGFAFPRRR